MCSMSIFGSICEKKSAFWKTISKLDIVFDNLAEELLEWKVWVIKEHFVKIFFYHIFT